MDHGYGDYESTSLERSVSVPGTFAGQPWGKKVRDAGIVWRRLTESDLFKLEHHQKSLTTMIQDRYRVSRKEADRQVSAFIQDQQSCSL